MFGASHYSNKVISQRERRAERRRQTGAVPSVNSSSDSDDFDGVATHIEAPAANVDTVEIRSANDVNSTNFISDDIENDECIHIPDQSAPLFTNSRHTVVSATKLLMRYAINVNLDKLQTSKLLKLVKSLLPQPNHLPTTHKKLLRVFGATSLFSTKHLCERCGSDIVTTRNNTKYCTNSNCLSSNQALLNSRVSEIVNMDIRSGLHSIVKTNWNLIFGNAMLTPKGDIVNYSDYVTNIEERQDRTLTLVLHADGAPLVRSSRQSLWPLFASLIEIPPPARYYQRNILTLALWSSRKKPDVDKFLDGTIAQLDTLIQHGTIILLDGQQHRFVIRVQAFVADLPAKALFLKTINFNGKFACTWCLSPGEYNSSSRMILYPFEKNNDALRTHKEFIRTGKSAASESVRTGHDVVIDGVRGVSPLLSVIKYPIGVLYDYMHLVCINHISTIVKHWLSLMKGTDILAIDDKLAKQKLPHNFNIRFDFSISDINQWKAKHGRLFILYVGLPILINVLPSSYLLHFAAYVIAIKLLHTPENDAEINVAEQLLQFYAQSSSLIYGSHIELYSLHSHLHLAQQVRLHGGLSYTSAFAFESCIRYVKKKAHGSRNLASQIGYWTDITTIIHQPSINVPQRHGVDEISIDHELLEEFKPVLNKLLGTCKVKCYKRFKIPFITFHSTLYDKAFRCVSHIISYRHKHNDAALFADCIVFLEFHKEYFVFIRKYHEETREKCLSATMKISNSDKSKIAEPLDRLFSMQLKSNSYGIISVSRIRHKCISVPFGDSFCITEIRNDFEHD